uniref:Uncharacterized protein n=1 Tax=Arundo donax TaxID=35708 RepID=A0A0A9BKK6_ARUDO
MLSPKFKSMSGDPRNSSASSAEQFVSNRIKQLKFCCDISKS